MSSLRKCVATILIITLVIGVVIRALSLTASDTNSQQVLRYGLTGPRTNTLYLYWPSVTGVAQIPLLTLSGERRQDKPRDPSTDAISITWNQTQ